MNLNKISIIISIFVFFLLGALVLKNTSTKKAEKNNSSYPTATPTTVKTNDAPIITVIPADKTNNSLKSYIHKHNSGFPTFSIQYPSGWELKNEIRNLGYTESSTLSFIKGDYEVRIYQAPVDGGWCIFEGDMPEGIYQDLRNVPYMQIESGIGTLRRVKSAITYYSDSKNMMSFTFCHKNNAQHNNYTDYSSTTSIGQITYTLPTQYDESTLLEMDNIIKSVNEMK